MLRLINPERKVRRTLSIHDHTSSGLLEQTNVSSQPPYTNKGGNQIKPLDIVDVSSSVDWLQYTVEWPVVEVDGKQIRVSLHEALKAALPPFLQILGDDGTVRPLTGYTHALRLSQGIICWHSQRYEQKICVSLTGNACKEAWAAGHDPVAFLAFLHAAKANITRLDLCTDYRKTADPLDLERSFHAGDVVTRVRDITHTVSAKRGAADEQATTVYFGSAKSPKRLKVYDKAKQTNTEGPWVRLEMTLRHDYANAAAAAIFKSSLPAVTAQVIRDFINFPLVNWFQAATTGEAVQLAEIPRKETNRELWLAEQILPLIKREIGALEFPSRSWIFKQLLSVLSSVLPDGFEVQVVCVSPIKSNI